MVTEARCPCPGLPWPRGPPGSGQACAAPTFPERDLAEPLDQKMVTWETVQKENYLSRLERQRKDSKEEVLRKTAHRYGLGASIGVPCSTSQGRAGPRVGRGVSGPLLPVT